MPLRPDIGHLRSTDNAAHAHLAIGANFCFIGYGAMGLFMPVLMLHLILVPINIIRLLTLVEQFKVPLKITKEKTDRSLLPGFSS
jgi:hypothetical protein